MNTTLIRNGLLVDADGSKRADLLIEGSTISRIAPVIDPQELPDDVDIVEAEGLCVMPGIIDAHTHYHLVSRGTVTADSFVEGSQLAAYGGVTTVIDFADHDKSKTLTQNAQLRIDAMKQGMAIDFALHQGVYGMHENIDAELAELASLGVRTIKIFTTYKNVGYLIEMEGLRELFAACKRHHIMISAHCEDDALIESVNENHTGTYTPVDHAILRPAEAEYRAIMHLGMLAQEADVPLYVVHLSSARGLDAVHELRAEGVNVIVETTPHYLFLDASYLEGPQGPLYVMTPPLRTEEDNAQLQHALSSKEFQVVATDHCAFTRDQKLASFPERRSCYL
jgi:dihydropyrimidinase